MVPPNDEDPPPPIKQNSEDKSSNQIKTKIKTTCKISMKFKKPVLTRLKK